MILRACSFLQCLGLFEPARQGRMVSLWGVMMNPNDTDTPIT